MNNTRTSLFLMANLGSEVSRFLNSVEKKDKDLMEKSKLRAEKIIDEIENKSDMFSRKKEIEKIRLVISDFVKEKRELSISIEDFKNYFNPFYLRFAKEQSKID
jgi:hypothetical protein